MEEDSASIALRGNESRYSESTGVAPSCSAVGMGMRNNEMTRMSDCEQKLLQGLFQRCLLCVDVLKDVV